MPLTKSDKLIIVGAVVLALAVVAGLAAWRKPHLFTGSRPAPEMTTRDFTAPAPAPSAPPAATTPVPPAPPIPPAPASPAPPPAAATPTTAPPGAAPISQQAPAAPPGISGPGISSPVADTSPAPGRPASPPHEAVPSAPAALSAPGAPAAPGTPAKEPVSPEIVSQHPLFAGDQALDKMFSDMSQEAAAPKVDTGKRPAAPEQTPPGQTPPGQAAAPHVPAPDPVPATAEALDLPVQKPGLAAKKPVKDKPVATGKPAASPSRGAVVAVSAADKPGEYVLTVTTTSPVGEVTRLYMDGPPRLVIDLDGRWTYTGPLSLPGKSPLIRMVRVGKHPDRLRLVLDLAPEATTRLREAPVLDRTSNGVVIRLPK